MTKTDTLKQLRSVTRRLDKAQELRAERDNLMRLAKSEGATWAELQDAAGMNSPTAVAQALKRGLKTS